MDVNAGERLSHSRMQFAAQPLAFRFERVRQDLAQRLRCTANTGAQIAIGFEQAKIIARGAELHMRQALQFPTGEKGIGGVRFARREAGKPSDLL